MEIVRFNAFAEDEEFSYNKLVLPDGQVFIRPVPKVDGLTLTVDQALMMAKWPEEFGEILNEQNENNEKQRSRA